MKKILCVGLLLLGLTACGHDSSSPSSSTNDPSASGPNVGNLPPPTRDNLESQNTIFFQQKEVWNGFSEELKKKVEENYGNSASMTGGGAGGHGYYNTLFGRVSPVFGPQTNLPPVTVTGANGQPTTYILLADTVGCDVSTAFLCVDQPVDGANTVVDSVLVQGSINMSQAALFSPSDPVLLVSVFRQSGESVGSYSLMATDITVTPPASPGDPEIGSFQKTVGLAGPGAYAIVLSAFKDTGDSVDLVSIGRTVIRQDVPQISLVDIMPPDSPDPGNLYPTDPTKRHTAVNAGDTVSMTSAKVTVKLASPGTSNVGVEFENLDETGSIRYISNGDVAFGSTTEADGSSLPTKSASMILFPGLNHIKITAHNTVLDSLGLSPATPSTVEFNLTNVVPSVNIKLNSPADGSLIEPAGNTIQNVSINFCLTDLASLPGRPSPAPAGQCIKTWSGEKPKLAFNGYTLPDDQVTLNSSDGTYTASVTPLLGGNVISVSVTNKQFFPPPPPENPGDPERPATAIGTLSASFGFGKVNKLYVGGQINEDNNFLKRGLSLAIGKKILTDDVKKMLTTYLNRPDFTDTLKKSFGSATPTAPSVCWDYGVPTNNSGDTTVEFLTGDGDFTLGSIEIPQLETRNDNLMAVTAIINGFHAKANLRSVDGPTVTYGGQDVSFIPLDIEINKLTVKVGIRFVKRDGVNELDIVPTEMENGLPKVISVEGGNGLGGYVHVDSSRNPSAEGLELMDNQRGTIAQQFKDTLNRTLLCGVENGLNPPDHYDIKNPPASGMGYWIADLQKLIGYNNLNPFRIPLEFDLLNKLIGIDISYDLLRADSITFNDRGLNVRNVPLRINPSPRVLNGLTDAIKNSLIGSLSMPTAQNETAAADPAITDNRNLGLDLSEDAINEALFSASMAGLLDLDIDPNFYTYNEIGFIDQATPTVQDMLGDGALVDLNQNGVADDSRLPVLLRLNTDKTLPPTMHFLTQSETDALAQRVNPILNNTSAASGSGGTPPSGGGTSPAPGDPKSLNTQAKYFRLSLSNLDISLYRVYPLGSDVGGVKTFCSWKNDPIAQPDASNLPNVPAIVLQGGQPDPAYAKACPQTLSPYVEKTATGCPNENDYKEVVVPVKNGPIISADPSTADMPVVRFKGNLVLLGVIEGVFRETLFADQYDLDLTQSPPALVPKAGAKPTNFIRLKFFPSDLGPEALLAKLKVVENRTSFTEAQLSDRIANTLIPAALGGNCQRLNEIRIPLPDRFPSETASSSGGLIETLNNFGVDHLDLGETTTEVPQAFIDDNRLFVDVLAHVGVCYQGDACTQSQKKSLSGAALSKIKMNLIDWTKH